MKCSMIVAAAGSGKRLGKGKNKVLLDFAGRPLLSYCLEVFDSISSIQEIIITAPVGEKDEIRQIAAEYVKSTAFKIVPGGAERMFSIANSLDVVADNSDVVLIHDGARPFITKELTETLIAAVEGYDGSVPAHPVKETVKRSKNGVVRETVPREDLFLAQTPQVFRTDVLKRSYKKALADAVMLTDDCGAVEYFGGKIVLVPGDEKNIKITTPFDWEYGEYLLKRGK